MSTIALLSASSSSLHLPSSLNVTATSSLKPLPFLISTSRTTTASKPKSKSKQHLSITKCALAIEKETPEENRPDTFLREADTHLPITTSSATVRSRFEKMIREAQDTVCAAIETADGGGKFKEDVWSRPGGGGISRVLQDGAVWEKAGVNVSVVYGVMPPDAYRAANPGADHKPGPVPFFAAGVSSVYLLHLCIAIFYMFL